MDGHYWIELNGEIIDPYFKSYDKVKSLWDLTDEQFHLEASPLIQTIFLRQLQKVKAEIEEFNKDGLMKWTDTANCCNINAMAYQKKHGGRIVFGSMGWKRKNGKGIHYEFGGEDYTVAKFMKK